MLLRGLSRIFGANARWGEFDAYFYDWDEGFEIMSNMKYVQPKY